MSGLHMSRARLRARRGEALSAIAPLLAPADRNRQAGHAHRVLWLLFQDVPDASRDFLWRDEGNGRYMILSRRPPVDSLGLFELQTKPFEPVLTAGDRLAFVLRANPVMSSKQALDAKRPAGRVRGKRVDVVMHALTPYPKDQRIIVRDKVASEAGKRWLAQQAEKAGFRLVDDPDDPLVIDGYEQMPLERSGRRPAGFSKLDIAGKIIVADPETFMAKLASGFGAAKAFGNGLMLIKRA